MSDCLESLRDSTLKRSPDECQCPSGQVVTCMIKHKSAPMYTCAAAPQTSDTVQYVIDTVNKPKTSWVAPDE